MMQAPQGFERERGSQIEDHPRNDDMPRSGGRRGTRLLAAALAVATLSLAAGGCAAASSDTAPSPARVRAHLAAHIEGTDGPPETAPVRPSHTAASR